MKRPLMFACCMLLTVIALSPVRAGINESTELFSHTWGGEEDPALTNDQGTWWDTWLAHPQDTLKDTVVLDFTWHDRGMDSPWYNEMSTKNFWFSMYPHVSTIPGIGNGPETVMNFSKDNNHCRFEYAVPEDMLRVNDNWLKDPDNEIFFEHPVAFDSYVRDDAHPIDDSLTMRVSTYDSGRYVNDNNTADQPAPEPSTWVMIGTGLVGFIAHEIRKRKRNA